MDILIVRFWDLANKFLLLQSPTVKMWQQLLGPLVSLEQFVPRGSSLVVPPSVAAEGPLVSSLRQSSSAGSPISGVQGMQHLVAPGGSGASLGVPSASHSVHRRINDWLGCASSRS